MAATPRTTSRACSNREHPVVTRHGLRSPHAAIPPLRQMPPGTPITKISANVLDISRGQIAIPASPGEKSHSRSPTNAGIEPASQSPQPGKTRNPHRPSPQPRGFVHGRFPDAGPVPRRAAGDGRRPKTFTIHDILDDPTSRYQTFISATGNARLRLNWVDTVEKGDCGRGRRGGGSPRLRRGRSVTGSASRYRLWDRQQLGQFPEVLCCGDLPKFFGPRLT
jgi:hypothetical protein